MNANLIYSLLEILSFTLVIIILFRSLHLPLILGYVTVGAIIGPYGIGLLQNSETVHYLADFGIVFLMFTIGLKFSFRNLWQLKKSILFLGGMQVTLTMLITMAIGIELGMTSITAFIVGSIVAMSSTAIVLKQLGDQNELEWSHAQNSIGILLFQDIAVVPLMLLVASFTTATQEPLIVTLGFGCLKGVIALGIIFVVGKWILRPLFHLVASPKLTELFTLLVLLITLASAALTNSLGLSYALGAFMAGIMLAETGYKHQIEVEIRPFRDILLGLFFISIGMLLNVHALGETWVWIVLLLLALVFGKFLLIALLARFSRINNQTSVRIALCLAQGGEFGFAILSLAMQHYLISEAYGQVILSALLISMMMAPIVIRFNRQIANALLPARLKDSNLNIGTESTNTKHVAILGYGRVGKQVAKIFKQAKVPYRIIEHNPNKVHYNSTQGEHILLGDVTHPEILKLIKFENTLGIVICLGSATDAERATDLLRKLDADVPIIVRCHEDKDTEELNKAGANIVIPETLDSSLMIAYHMLSMIETEDSNLQHILDALKKKHDELSLHLAKL